MTRNITIISTFLLLTSCDCNQIVRGTVVDTDTKRPIDSVFVYKESRPSDKSYTDTSGAFQVKSISGGPFGCPGMTIVLEKNGYEKKVVTIDCGGVENIALKSIK